KPKGQSKTGQSTSSPLFVKVVPADKSPDDASYEAYEHYEKPSLDRGLTYATTALAVFTFALFLGTGVLAIFTYRLWGETRDLVKETSSVESPFLIPELVQMTREWVANIQQPVQQPIVTYTFRNHGKTPAIIRRFQDRLRLLPQLPNSEQDIYGI